MRKLTTELEAESRPDRVLICSFFVACFSGAMRTRTVPVQSSMHVKIPQKASSSFDDSRVTSTLSLPSPGIHHLMIGLPEVLPSVQSPLSAMYAHFLANACSLNWVVHLPTYYTSLKDIMAMQAAQGLHGTGRRELQAKLKELVKHIRENKLRMTFTDALGQARLLI